jgi:hypothetical protein
MLNFKILSYTTKKKDISTKTYSEHNPYLIDRKTNINNIINNKFNKDIPVYNGKYNSYSSPSSYDDLLFDDNHLDIQMKEDALSFLDTHNNTNIGSLNIDDILDIINYEVNMKYPKDDIHKQKKYIFNNLLGHFKYNNDMHHTDFIPINYKKSIFMKNLEALMFLNNTLHQFQKLEKIKKFDTDEYNFKKLSNTFDRFIHIILLKTLELINVISRKLKDNPDNKELKQILVKYTIGIVFRISQYVQKYSDKMIHKIENINNEEHKLNNIKALIGGKMDKLTSRMNKQNNILKKYYKLFKNKY